MTSNRDHDLLYVDRRRKISLILKRNSSNETVVLLRWESETRKLGVSNELISVIFLP